LEKLSTKPSVELLVRILWTIVVATQNAIEETPPQNPVTSAQISVT